METEQVHLCEIVVAEYRVLLRMEGELTLPTDCPKIRAFLEQLFQNTLVFGKEVLGKALRDEYATLPGAHEKARFPTTRAAISCKLLYSDESYAVFLSSARWSGQKTGVYQYASAWILPDEILLLPQEVKKHEKLKNHAENFGEKAEKRLLKILQTKR